MATPDGLGSDIDSEFSATIRLDPRIYSKEAILRACYWHTNVAYIHIPESHDETLAIRIELKQKGPSLENPKPLVIGEFLPQFCNSLLDFELRRQVDAETASIRQLILAKAFSESGVLEDEPIGTMADPVEDANHSSLVQIVSGAGTSTNSK
jgi:His-Xaa-Ser system protein HxsD